MHRRHLFTLALLPALLILFAGCWEGFPTGSRDGRGGTTQRDPDRPSTDADAPSDVDAPADDRDDDGPAGDSSPPDAPSPVPVPTVRLSREGGLDSVTLAGRELLAPSVTGRRKPLVDGVALVSLQGLTARFRQRESGNEIDVRFEPVPGGYDLHLTTDAKQDAEVHLWLEPLQLAGAQQALLPTWAGHVDLLSFPAAWGQEYDYPGRSFAPVIAFWNAERTAGYTVLAQVGDFVRLKVYQPPDQNDILMPRLSLLNGWRAGERLERVITVRYSDSGGDWRSVLRPYQAHQLRRDGSVRYERLGPWVSYNLRNSHDYNEAKRDFEPGSTWENRLGKHWEWALSEARQGRLALGCLGVWAQMEEIDRQRYGFNPNVTDFEKSLGGTLAGLIDRLRREYGPIPVSAFARPTRKIDGGRTVPRDLDDPREWKAALAQLEGLRQIGCDLAYGDEVGIHGGWRVIELVEQAPVRIISEWAWDRLLTRGSCLMAHHNFPRAQAALLVPYLTSGGELYVRARPERLPLFAEGAVTPWEEWVSPHNQQVWNRMAALAQENRPELQP